MESETRSSPIRILVARPDRIGDVILSTPVFEVLRRYDPRFRITVLVREAVAPLVQGLSSVDEVMIFDPEGRHRGVNGFFQLTSEIRERNFRYAVALHSHWKVAAAMFAAGIRDRVGPLSKPHSYLFYSRGVRQHRSNVEMHETDYNLQLLRKLGIRAATRTVPVAASISDERKEQARAWLAERGWVPDETRLPLIAVHPGMGGSALNWPENHYAELVKGLLAEGYQVVLTGGPAEGDLLKRIVAAQGETAPQPWVYASRHGEGVDFLGGIFSWSHLVVAPSTGPMHLAVALGKPVVTFFPPIRVQSALRWGPYVTDPAAASILVPEVYCGEDFTCRGNLCNYYPCMKSLSVPQALEEVHRQLSRGRLAGAV